MTTITCKNNCCNLKVEEFTSDYNNISRKKPKKSKAGVFIFDPESQKILLVQSRGNFWGPPKGTMKYGETWLSCAIREVKEETGLNIDKNNFLKACKIKNTSFYFYLEMKECDLNVQYTVIDNDANGIGWIKLNCLIEMINNEYLDINKHCKILIKKFLNMNI